MTVNEQKQIVAATTASNAAVLHLLLIVAEVDERKKIPLKMCTCSSENEIERDGENNENAISGNSNVELCELYRHFLFMEIMKGSVHIQNRCIKMKSNVRML